MTMCNCKSRAPRQRLYWWPIGLRRSYVPLIHELRAALVRQSNMICDMRDQIDALNGERQALANEVMHWEGEARKAARPASASKRKAAKHG